MAKFSIKKLLGFGLAASIVTGGVIFGADTTNKSIEAMNDYVQDENNMVFEEDKVNEDMVYYGGDEGYLEMKTNLVTPYVKDKVKLYNHFDPGHDGDIKVGFDKTVTDEQITQFNYTFDHLNYVFDVVNPDYKFATGRFSKKDCDIWVDFSRVGIASEEGKVVGAYVDWDFDFYNPSVIRSAEIHFNKELNFNTPELRYIMLHEMQHILFASHDLESSKQEGFSTYSSFDMNFILKQISCAYESLEDYQNGTIRSMGGHWKPTFIIQDSNGNPIGRPFLPLMTREEKNSFVSLLPIDASTLVALYGDSSKPENRQAYLKLLHEILAKNKKVFDIDYSQFGENHWKVTEQPYYDTGYKLPEYTEDEEYVK